MAFNIGNLLSNAADLLLPDICAVCGSPLVLERAAGIEILPLCGSCYSAILKSLRESSCPNLGKCVKCGYPLISEARLCGRCRERNWHFDSADSLFFYDGVAKELIRAYKFDNRKKLAFLFADLLYRKISASFTGYTIVPVPFRPSSRRKRGWDQVEAVAVILEKKYSITVSRCLRRREGRAQKTMDYEHRLSNLENKIFIIPGSSPPARVLLLDDVFTTGATMDCCAGVLSTAGASLISCYSLAIDL